jgi:hypothetical protein
VAAGGVQSPLEHIALQDDGTVDLALLQTLRGGADIDDQASGGGYAFEFGRCHPPDPSPGLVQQLVGGGRHRARLSGA